MRNHLNEINTLYYNDYGIAFQWKRCAAKNFKKIQLVFRDTGLFLTSCELRKFHKNIQRTYTQADSEDFCNDENYKGYLLPSPAPQISFALSYEELTQLHDLVYGTLFQVDFDHQINNLLNS